MYFLDIKPEADQVFRKLSKRNPKQLIMIHKKLEEIKANPQHKYKFLRKPLQLFNRVHIDTHFVLIFKINHEKTSVDVYCFDHHDRVYLWRPKNQSE